MRILSVYDDAFRSYGSVLEGYDFSELIAAMNRIEMPEEGSDYEASVPLLESCAVFNELQARAYGGMPVQLGLCWGYNTKLNCLEYHKDSELNIAADDMILLLAKREQIIDGKLDTGKAKAFRVPAGCGVEIYATTLHYTPCQCAEHGFRSAVMLAKGTNTDLPAIRMVNSEDRMLAAKNKWLLAHPDSSEAHTCAYAGLHGENIDITQL